jgi:hypothetical protein
MMQRTPADDPQMKGRYGKEEAPFIDEIYTNNEAAGALQMTNTLLCVPPKAGNDGKGSSKSNNVLELFRLYQDMFIAKCHAEGNFSVVVTHDSLLPIPQRGHTGGIILSSVHARAIKL